MTSTDTGVPPVEIEKIEATPEAVKQAELELAELADRNRRMHATLTFEEFEAEVFKEPFEGGKYIVNGDTPIANEKLLREFYEQNVKPRQPTRLIVDQISGLDNKWSAQQQRQLRYCVSTAFGQRHAEVVRDMTEAATAWETPRQSISSTTLPRTRAADLPIRRSSSTSVPSMLVVSISRVPSFRTRGAARATC